MISAKFTLSTKGDASLCSNLLCGKMLQMAVFHFSDIKKQKSMRYNFFIGNKLQQSEASPFKYVDRGYRHSIVLIPGWASDYRIFSTLDLRFNYLIPLHFSPFTFTKDILVALKKNNIAKISLFGWSLGAFVAKEFALGYTNLVDEVILIGIRKRYKTENLKDIREHLRKSKRGYLYKFYTQCFSRKEEMGWFRENLLKVYCEKLSLDDLLKGLDYLENTEMKPELLNGIEKVTIIHGKDDRIAPIQEAIDIKEKLPRARFVCIKNAGHIPFLKKDFNKIL